MGDGNEWTALLIMLLLLVLPAALIFGVLNFLRIRRERTHRQRITKGRTNRQHREHGDDEKS